MDALELLSKNVDMNAKMQDQALHFVKQEFTAKFTEIEAKLKKLEETINAIKEFIDQLVQAQNDLQNNQTPQQPVPSSQELADYFKKKQEQEQKKEEIKPQPVQQPQDVSIHDKKFDYS